ncbi:MAG: hypothetical protein HY744_31735 [Deltaproteobacteria bacterium]|nr:hypothetical protein [Deltaproteobacteria bacterium]
MRRNREAVIRAAERRSREDAAARLRDEVPELRSLSLQIEERDGSDDGAERECYVRLVVVERAPALFELGCRDRRCQGGGYDLSAPVIAALRRRQVRFDGRCSCRGRRDGRPCAHELRYVAVAGYGTGGVVVAIGTPRARARRGARQRWSSPPGPVGNAPEASAS